MDIELLIKYTQDKGYLVEVMPRGLIIRKYAGDLLYSIAWMIDKSDLEPQLWGVLTEVADRKCAEIEQSIAAHVAHPNNALT